MKLSETANELRKLYKIPALKARELDKKFNTFAEMQEHLAQTDENWCYSFLDYRDSEELKELRRNYAKGKKLRNMSLPG
jgi:hypothetical protein